VANGADVDVRLVADEFLLRHRRGSFVTLSAAVSEATTGSG
jgi:hypothetical protein